MGFRLEVFWFRPNKGFSLMSMNQTTTQLEISPLWMHFVDHFPHVGLNQSGVSLLSGF